MKQRRIFTAGYSGRTPGELCALADRLEADIFDIRLSCRSRRPEWNKGPLSRLFGDRYRHVPALGNLNFKGEVVGADPGRVILANPEAGIAEILQHPRPVILLCQCKDLCGCHRSDVAALLSGRPELTVEEVTWEE